MNNEMKYLVNKYVYRYINTVGSTFGWNEDDLRQEITIILWKGVATFDESRKIKMTTYLSTILYYQMGNLSKKCQNKKNSMSKLYCPEDLFESEFTSDLTSCEDWFAYSQSFYILMDKMTKLESQVLISHLLDGNSITQIQKKLKIKKPLIVAAFKSLKEKMNKYLGDYDEQKDSLH